MRTHSQIIVDAAGPHAVARLILPHVDADEVTLQKRVRAWSVTGSVPGEYWALFERLGIGTTAEMAADAASRKGVTLPANDDTLPQSEAA